MLRRLLILLGVLAVLAPSQTWAQGVLVVVDPHQIVRLPRPIPLPTPVPEPAPTYKIKELAVDARLDAQIARVQVSQSFVNTGSQQMEVSFIFPLPYDGAIDQLTLLVDGKEFPAKLLEAKQAREVYESIVRKNKDPALLEWLGTGMFKTSVFPVPAGAERKVTLRYTQLCRKDNGLTDFVFPLSTARYTSQPVETVKFQISIDGQSPIKNVYSPTHALDIKRPDDKHAVVRFEAKDHVPSGDFRLLYDVGQEPVAARVVSYRPCDTDDGYFVLLATPEIKADSKELPKKTVVFVVDRSGSMSGEKIEQAKNALKFVLNNLREGDLFNIVAYDAEVQSFRPELQKFDPETRAAALGFVEGLFAGGSTNIDGALAAALGQLKDTSRPNFVIFLTDGLPTQGETNEAKIAAAAKQRNDVRARLFAFGVGYDVNSRLLDKLAREGHGLSEYVRPNENIEASVSKLYGRIASPVMTDVKFDFQFDNAKTEQGPPVQRVYPSGTFDLFAGEQLVLVGRYKQAGAAKVVVRGQVGNEEKKFEFPAEFAAKTSDDSFAFAEKLWASRRVGEILDQLDLNGPNEELVKELVQLSTRHGILTPYTSFLADENTNLRDLAANSITTNRSLESLAETDGLRGVAQRRAKAGYQRSYNGTDLRSRAVDRYYAESRQLDRGGASYGAGGRGGYGAPAAGAPLESAASGPALSVAAPAAQPVAVHDTETDDTTLVAGVMQIGNKTFYHRNNRWVDSALTEEQEKQAKPLERYSSAYFELAANNATAAKLLGIEAAVVLEIDGQAYVMAE